MSNLSRLRSAMADKGFGAILVSSSTNIFWLSGFTGSFAYILVTANEAIFITDSRYAIQAGEQVSGFDVRIFRTPTTGLEMLRDALQDTKSKQVGFEGMYVTCQQLDSWQSKLEGVSFVTVNDMLELLRMVKTPDEISKIQKACDLTDAAYAHIERLIQPGVSEFEIQLELEFYVRRQGGSMAFDPIIVSGANSARPHGHATEKPLEVGDFVTMDFGAKLDGYCADMTRTVVVGKASDRTREIYEQVLKSQLAALDMMKPGVIAEDVDRKVRDILDEKGLAQYFGHGLGHGLGILVHDTGRLGIGSKTVLEPGQIWTIEPGVYIEGFGGCRIEDDVVITETGITIFNKTTKELRELTHA